MNTSATDDRLCLVPSRLPSESVRPVLIRIVSRVARCPAPVYFVLRNELFQLNNPRLEAEAVWSLCHAAVCPGKSWFWRTGCRLEDD